MEIGKAVHYRRGNTRDNSAICYISCLSNGQMVKWGRENIAPGSELLKLFPDVNGMVVAFDLVNLVGSMSGAKNVRLLKEVDTDTLMEQLSPASRRSPLVQRFLMDRTPSIRKFDKISDCFPYLMDQQVYQQFLKLAEDGQPFARSMTKWIEGAVKPQLPDSFWQDIDWAKQPVQDVRGLAVAAAKKNLDITFLCVHYPDIWHDPKFLNGIPYSTFEAMFYDPEFSFSQKDYEFIALNAESFEKEQLVTNNVPMEWLVATPELCENRGLPWIFDTLKEEIDWIKTDEEEAASIRPFLLNLQKSGIRRIVDKIVSLAERNWVNDKSPLWSCFTEEVQKRIAADYERMGFSTESNYREDPRLTEFLDSPSGGNLHRTFSLQQKTAIQAIQGVNLLFAVPGSGKTTVLLTRAGYMTRMLSIPPETHLIMTFNTAAANDMKKRYHQMFPEEQVTPDFRTIHSFCYAVVAALEKKGQRFPILLKSPEEEKEEGRQKRHIREVASAILKQPTPEKIEQLYHGVRQLRSKRMRIEMAARILIEPGLTLADAFGQWEKRDISQKNLIRNILGKMPYDEEGNIDVETVQTMIGYIKNRMLKDEDVLSLSYPSISGREYPIWPIFNQYQKHLETYNLMDVDDMLARAYQGLLKYPDVLEMFQNRYPYVSVDETQDTSLLQHEIIHVLTRRHGNLFMVGDDDQSIYAFRGADPKEMVEFRNRYPTGRQLLMLMNYRSDERIVRVADAFISGNRNRVAKRLEANSKKQGSVSLLLSPDMKRQYEYIVECAGKVAGDRNGGDLAVLFRWNLSALPVMAALYLNDVPFVCSKEQESIRAVFAKQEIKRIINLIRSLNDPTNFEAFKDSWFLWLRNVLQKKDLPELERFYTSGSFSSVAEAAISFLKDRGNEIKPAKEALEKLLKIRKMSALDAIAFMLNQKEYGLLTEEGTDSINKWMRIYAIMSVAEMCGDQDIFLSFIDSMQKEKWHAFNSRVRLSTMHSAKGAEFDHVIIVDALDEVTPGQDEQHPLDEEEERRLFYVAMTRARHVLDIIYVDLIHDRPHAPTRFIAEILKHPEWIETRSLGPVSKSRCVLCEKPILATRANIYAIYEKAEKKEKVRWNEKTATYPSYNKALLYLHRSYADQKKHILLLPAHLPAELSQRLLAITEIEELDDTWVDILRQFPLDMYKIWAPLTDLMKNDALPAPSKVRVLVLNAGIGAVSGGICQFYSELAGGTPKMNFSLGLHAMINMEAEEMAYSEIHDLHSYKQDNFLLFEHELHDLSDAARGKVVSSGDYDLIVLDGGNLTPEEMKELYPIRFIINNLRNYGFYVVLSGGGKETLQKILRQTIDIGQTSLFLEYQSGKRAKVDPGEISVMKQMEKSGFLPELPPPMNYGYSIFQKRNLK